VFKGATRKQLEILDKKKTGEGERRERERERERERLPEKGRTNVRALTGRTGGYPLCAPDEQVRPDSSLFANPLAPADD